MSDDWYYADRNGRVGPLTIRDLRAAIETRINRNDIFIWRDGFDDWKRLSDVTDLTVSPPPLPREITKPRYSRKLNNAVILIVSIIISILFIGALYYSSEKGKGGSDWNPQTAAVTDAKKLAGVESGVDATQSVARIEGAVKCLVEAQKVAAHEGALIDRQTPLVVILKHPAASGITFGCPPTDDVNADIFIAWDNRPSPNADTIKLIGSAGEFLTGVSATVIKKELANCVAAALKPDAFEFAEREFQDIRIDCSAFARSGGGGSATIYRVNGLSPTRAETVAKHHTNDTAPALTSRSFFDHLAVVSNLIVRCPNFEISERTLERYASLLGIDRTEIERRAGQFYIAILQSGEQMSISRDKACTTAKSLYGPNGTVIPELLSAAP